MRASRTVWIVGALALVSSAAGCGGNDTAILLSITADPAIAPDVRTIDLYVATSVWDTEQNAAANFYLKESRQTIELPGRNLAEDPYRILLWDGRGNDLSDGVMAAVVGYGAERVQIAAGRLDGFQPFVAGEIIERQVKLLGDEPYLVVGDCVLFDDGGIIKPGDEACEEVLRPDAAPGDPDAAEEADASPPSGDAAPADAGPADAAADASQVRDCDVDDDCPRVGAGLCYTQTCVEGACVPPVPTACVDLDLDCYGVGECAGPDCDDLDPTLQADGVQACYTGPAATEGVGVCHGGYRICEGGILASECSGELTPAVGEACNGLDDDCDGLPDEVELGILECDGVDVLACDGDTAQTCQPPAIVKSTICDVVVSTTGNDDTAEATAGLTPFGTVQGAVNFAADAGMHHVCVTQPSCATTANYVGSVVMSPGVSVHGGIHADTLTRCTGDGLRTILKASTTVVTFPDPGPLPIPGATVLDDVTITTSSPSADSVAIHIDAMQNVLLADVRINGINIPAAAWTGVKMENGAQALLQGVEILIPIPALPGTGLHSIGSLPRVLASCPLGSLFDGVCLSCGSGGPGIRAMSGNPDSVGVRLEDSPGAQIEGSAICTGSVNHRGVVEISGLSNDVVLRGNFISASSSDGNQASAIDISGCSGTGPWIVANEWIEGKSTTIDVSGDCAPIIDDNETISASFASGETNSLGVACSGGAPCTIDGNGFTLSAPSEFPIAVACFGGCRSVRRNTIDITGGEIQSPAGMYLSDTGALVDGNVVSISCGTSTNYGILAMKIRSRIVNNLVRVQGCVPDEELRVEAIRIDNGDLDRELEVHSNSFLALSDGACTSVAALAFAPNTADSPPFPARTILRNNVFWTQGTCPSSWPFHVEGDGPDPRILESNVFFAESGGVLYESAASGETASTAGDLDTYFAGSANNLAGDPGLSPSLHISPGSLCIDAGTTTGAPSDDYEGDVRSIPDIGADEF